MIIYCGCISWCIPVFSIVVVHLSTMFPDTLMLGMEIRVKVSDYVKDRVIALRKNHPGQYQNIACLRCNAMKYLPNFFRKGQVRYWVDVWAMSTWEYL